jgi:hypothetical protein
LKKDNKFFWEEGQEAEFKKLKFRFIFAPIISHFNPDLKIVMETVASGLAIGAILNLCR